MVDIVDVVEQAKQVCPMRACGELMSTPGTVIGRRGPTRHPPPASPRSIAAPSPSSTFKRTRQCRCAQRRRSFYTTTMAILRQLVVGVSASRPLATRLVASPSALTAYRLLSTSSRLHAQHVAAKGVQPNTAKSPSLGTKVRQTAPDPYHGGPSALEKAVHLFFFTEIIRGAPCVGSRLHGLLSVMHVRRNVACP